MEKQEKKLEAEQGRTVAMSLIAATWGLFSH